MESSKSCETQPVMHFSKHCKGQHKQKMNKIKSVCLLKCVKSQKGISKLLVSFCRQRVRTLIPQHSCVQDIRGGRVRRLLGEIFRTSAHRGRDHIWAGVTGLRALLQIGSCGYCGNPLGTWVKLIIFIFKIGCFVDICKGDAGILFKPFNIWTNNSQQLLAMFATHC